MTQRIFITGISGFLASHIALLLLKSGAQVSGSVRSMAKAKQVEEVMRKHGADTSQLSFVELDLLHDQGWHDAIAGHDYLIHTASPFVSEMPKDPEVLIRPAVDGVVRAIEAGLAAQVKRIVMTSSLAAMAFGDPGNRIRYLTNEDWTNPDGDGVNAYVRSKTLAERKAWELVEAAGQREVLSVINPGFIMGPVLERDIGTSGALLRKMLAGGFPGAPDIYFSSIDVRDVAQLHIAALYSEIAAGERFLAAGPAMALVAMAQGLAAEFPTFRRQLPTRKLPNFVIRLVALFDGDAKTATTLLGQIHHCDSKKAQELLGREFIASEEAATEMARTIIELGLV